MSDRSSDIREDRDERIRKQAAQDLFDLRKK